ncbi:integrin beta-1-like [Homarus americanus]|uniref:integrin beta-1-like n=1 Tax=Homarus americanus TaxID=6706 RepID=UPI001C44A1F5|nr:integrin beta-1-like [Homarus americanus]
MGLVRYIANSAKCNRAWHASVWVCRCYEGYVGEFCECELSDGRVLPLMKRDVTTSTSPKCSGRGECIVVVCNKNTDNSKVRLLASSLRVVYGLAVCNKNTDNSKIISGTHCQCTNYEGCQGANSLMCSDHGECKCDKCNCVEGWTGEFCDCENATHNCRQTENQEICSSHGRCGCNRCVCDATYLGKFCEDCTNCAGKCVEYKSCVQCQVFQTGELSPEECLTNCTDFNSTKVISIEDVEGQLCAFAQDDNCRFFFRFALNSAGLLGVWVQEELECTNPVSLKCKI